MLACARLGLTHSVVFAGFSSGALRSRVDDAEAKLVITTDGQYRRGEPAPPSRPMSTRRWAPASTPRSRSRRSSSSVARTTTPPT